MEYHKNTSAIFKSFNKETAAKLMKFAAMRKTKIGDYIEIDGKKYILDHVSKSSSQFFKSRGISIYFRVNRSILRISDHWTSTEHQNRSGKFNCGPISSCFWRLNEKHDDIFLSFDFGGSKYPHRLLAGICSMRSFKFYKKDAE